MATLVNSPTLKEFRKIWKELGKVKTLKKLKYLKRKNKTRTFETVEVRELKRIDQSRQGSPKDTVGVMTSRSHFLPSQSIVAETCRSIYLSFPEQWLTPSVKPTENVHNLNSIHLWHTFNLNVLYRDWIRKINYLGILKDAGIFFQQRE